MINTKKFVQLLLSLLVALSLFAAVLPQSVFAAEDTPTVACNKTHKVQKNETLSDIAKLYGVSLTMLARANDLTRPYDLDTGEKLCIPYQRGVAPVKGKISFSIKNNRLRIKVEDFTHWNTFFVKVTDAKDSTAGWTKLGILNVEKNEDTTVIFSLPDSLEDAIQLRVCLKHFYTNELTCYFVLRT